MYVQPRHHSWCQVYIKEGRKTILVNNPRKNVSDYKWTDYKSMTKAKENRNEFWYVECEDTA